MRPWWVMVAALAGLSSSCVTGNDRDAHDASSTRRDSGAVDASLDATDGARDAHTGDSSEDPRVDASVTVDAGREHDAAPRPDASERDGGMPEDLEDAGVDNTCPRSDVAPNCAPWTQVSSRVYHACGIAGGALYCWGSNDFGALGTGDTEPRERPTRIGTESDWKSVSAGESRTCAIRAEGRLFCWGRRDSDDISVSDTVLTPAQVGDATDWREVSVGWSYCGLRGSGALYCWGRDLSGSLDFPRRVGSSSTWSTFAFGGSGACGINQGRLYCADYAPSLDPSTTEPLGAFDDWVSYHHGGSDGRQCAIRGGGALYCWGGFDGITEPTQITEIVDWSTVSLRWDVTCGVRKTGDGYCWGRNELGLLGHGALADVPSPRRLEVAWRWQQIEISNGTAFGIGDGNLYSWGSNQRGLRGQPSQPERIGTESDWLSVSGAGGNLCGLRVPGSLHCWNYADRTFVPKRIGDASDWTRLVQRSNRCGIRSGGELYCWGSNNQGQLGNGTRNPEIVPARVGTAADWAEVAVGPDHTCGLRRTGELYCWGANHFGQIGHSVDAHMPIAPATAGEVLEPVQIEGTGWTAIAAGVDATCGVRSGALYCWGNTGYNLLDDPDWVGLAFAPVRVGLDEQWTSVDFVDRSVCGIRAGSLYCWGINKFGELGLPLPAVYEPLSITLVDAAHSWKQVAGDSQATCALTELGELACTGINQMGLLGTGDFRDRTSFTLANGAGWDSLTISYSCACAVRNGELYCWGACLLDTKGMTPVQVSSVDTATF